MAKVIIEYDLNDRDDMFAHKRAIKSLDLTLVLWEITYNMKKSMEHTLEGLDIKGEEISNFEVLQMVFDRIREELSDHNVDLDDLVE